MAWENDIFLVGAVSQGDTKAFERLFEKYHRPLYYHVLRFAKDERLAEDTVQDVFLKVWECRENLKPGLSFRAYLFKIGKNHIINILKRAAVDAKARMEVFASTQATNNGLEDEIILGDYRQIAFEAIEQLPPKRKAVFTLCRNEGKKHEEVAQIMDISIKTVRDHLYKAEGFIEKYFKAKAGITLRLAWLACVVFRGLF